MLWALSRSAQHFVVETEPFNRVASKDLNVFNCHHTLTLSNSYQNQLLPRGLVSAWMASYERVLIYCWGTRGDVQPLLALALRLRDIGKTVAMFVLPPSDEMAKSEVSRS